MEGRKNVGSSSSSITSQLFGSKDSPPSSSAGIFGSLFAPPSKAQIFGRESLRPAGAKTQHSPNESWNTKPGASALGNSCKAYEGENDNTENRDKSHMYRDQQIHPCHLSSSIYYGGQDLYVCPPGSQGSELGTVFKKDDGEDDSRAATRGNWWQGSLYY